MKQLQKIRKHIKFESKIGWPEVISLLSLIIAIAAYFESRQSARPNIVVDKITSTLATKRDDGGKLNQIIIANPIIITNRGGRATSLLGIKMNGDGNFILPVKDTYVRHDIKVPFEIFLIEKSFQEIVDSGGMGFSYKPLSAGRLSEINLSIPSGETKILTIGLVFKASDLEAQEIKDLIFTADLVFSDGTIHNYLNVYDLRQPNVIGKTT